MHPSFYPRLINDAFDDPGLFIPFGFQKRALIFDLGDIHSLPPKDILKISHAFVTHTHMDHFAGFDRLLRLFLGREKTISLFGPQGFLKNVEGKLAGYEWNLVRHFSYRLHLRVTEVRPQSTITREYRCEEKFSADGKAIEAPFNGILCEEPAFKVSTVILDHGTPCLGFAVKERFHVNIINEGLKTLGLEAGPWLSKFKQAIYSRSEPDSIFEITSADRETPKRYRLGDLSDQIARITPGQKISYITDVAYSPPNMKRILEFIKGSSELYIEAAFLERHRDIAAEKNHLTARQAGHLAALAGVDRFTVFHFSPRYMGLEQLLHREAAEACESAAGRR